MPLSLRRLYLHDVMLRKHKKSELWRLHYFNWKMQFLRISPYSTSSSNLLDLKFHVFDNITVLHLPRKSECLLFRVLSNCLFPHDSWCICGDQLSTSHFLFECPLLFDLRDPSFVPHSRVLLDSHVQYLLNFADTIKSILSSRGSSPGSQ